MWRGTGVGSARLRLHAMQTKIQVLVFGTLKRFTTETRKGLPEKLDQSWLILAGGCSEGLLVSGDKNKTGTYEERAGPATPNYPLEDVASLQLTFVPNLTNMRCVRSARRAASCSSDLGSKETCESDSGM